MVVPDDRDYYQARRDLLLVDFDRQVSLWQPHLASSVGDPTASRILEHARGQFNRLISRLPYIGGDANHLTPALIESARCLAFFQAMQAFGKSPAESGYILYQAELHRPRQNPPSAPHLSQEEIIQRRRQRALDSQERRFAWDYVFTYIPGDGQDFDYGYDFSECATQKFYKAQRSEAFLPYYCCLDFSKSARQGVRLQRTSTLADGGETCNFRFHSGQVPVTGWPPPCLSLAPAPAT